MLSNVFRKIISARHVLSAYHCTFNGQETDGESPCDHSDGPLIELKVKINIFEFKLVCQRIGDIILSYYVLIRKENCCSGKELLQLWWHRQILLHTNHWLHQQYQHHHHNRIVFKNTKNWGTWYILLNHKYSGCKIQDKDKQYNSDIPASDVKAPEHANLVAHDFQSHDFAMLILKVAICSDSNITFNWKLSPLFSRPLLSSLPEFVQSAFLSRQLLLGLPDILA